MRVKEMVIDGFKSYAKRTVISNWDSQFNCITGLNGSGKSNILDAICFVLGITTMSTVRASNQQDLIYKRGQAGVTKANVSIVFDNTDKSKSPMDYRDVDTITVTRIVVLGGTSKYLVNGHRKQQNQVQQLFHEVQLNVNNPNFLIMQGQITKVVNMRPTEILGLIEEAAGTGMYEKERVKATKDIRDRDAPLFETESLLNEEVRPKLEKLRGQKRKFLEFQQLAAAIEATERIVAISEWSECSKRLEEIQSVSEAKAARTEELKARINAEVLEMQTLQGKFNNLKDEQTSEEIARMDFELQTAKMDQARVATEIEFKQEQLKSVKVQIEQCSDTSTDLNQKLSRYQTGINEFETTHAKLQELHKQQSKLVKEKRELLMGLETGVSTSGEREVGYAYTTKCAREALSDARQKLAALQAQKQRIQSQAPDDTRIAQLQDTIKESESQLVKISELEITKQNQLDALSEDAKTANHFKNNYQEAMDMFTQITQRMNQLISQCPHLEVPEGSPKDENFIRGRLAHVFRVSKQHDDKLLALESCAGGQLWSVVVDNDSVCNGLISNSKTRINILPLNQMRTSTVSIDVVKQIDANSVWRACDLLEFDETVRPAVEHVFGNTVICATHKMAERAAFQFKVRSVTLEGDIYDPRGVLSGGYNKQRNRAGRSVFSVVEEYCSLFKEKCNSDRQIYEWKQKFDALNQTVLAADQLKNELDLVRHEALIARKSLEESHSRLQELTQTKQLLHNLECEQIPEAAKAEYSAQQALEKALADASDFARNREAKLAGLQKEVECEIAKEHEINEKIASRSEQHARNQLELEQLKSDLTHANEQKQTFERTATELLNDINSETQRLSTINAKIIELDGKLLKEVSKADDVRIELAKIDKSILLSHESIAEMKLELQEAINTLENHDLVLREAQLALENVKKNFPWADEAAISSPSEIRSGPELEQLKKILTQDQRRMNSLASKFDSGVVTMIEKLETDESKLRQRLITIREDRRKLQESMETLNERRKRTIDSVWHQVSEDFGKIFGDLLPNSSCKLVPSGEDPIHNGFIISVRLGAVWKDGLTELSGGQRSLVALSLILALLRYHPAPMYILDEVDAALDVHHTRNIGHIIKTRFQNAQFIVVSLKDDMFTNANRIYQTRFIDGTSTVAVMV